MAGFTDYLEGAVLKHILGVEAFAQPTDRYIALSTTTPDESGGNFTEPSGGGYQRAIEQGNPPGTSPYWNGASGSWSNRYVITFDAATASWGTIVAFGIYDALSGGNLLMWGSITPGKTINSGDQAAFAVGALQVNLD